MNRRAVLSGLSGLSLAAFTPWKARAEEPYSLKGYIRTNWSQDPWSYGSYSYFASESNRKDVKALEKPISNRIFFAGEATYPWHNSTVHAAYESGQRIAEFVLDEDIKSVAIIGAGMSGLSASHKLSSAGLDVTIFEARDRIGGRIWTRDDLGMPLDCGASWIHGVKKNPLTKLSDRASLTRIKTDDSYIIRTGDGDVMDDELAPDWLNGVIETQHTVAADADQVNDWAYLWTDSYSGPDVKFPNGYAEIFSALGGDYDIQLSSPIKHIEQKSDSVKLTTHSNVQKGFDAAIVTIPLGVLKRGDVTFSPPLPDRKREAIQKLGMGTLDKVYLLFNDVFWDEDITWIVTPQNDLPRGQFNQWLNLYKYIGEPVIMAFNGGSPALDLSSLSDDTIINRALETLRMAYQG